MKRFISIFICVFVLFGISGCGEKESSQVTDATNQSESSKTIDDFIKAKTDSDKIIEELNTKIEDTYTYSNFIYNENWLHIIYKNSTPVTFEIDFKIDETFSGITIDNHSTEEINSGFRSIPIAAASLSIFNINAEDKQGIIDLLMDLEQNNYNGSNINVMDSKVLNIFSISVK